MPDDPDLISLLAAAVSIGMSASINDIGGMCAGLSHSDRRILAKMLGTMAADSPVISYLPYASAERILSYFVVNDEDETGFGTDLQDVLQLDAPLLLEFCLAIDRMHACTHVGEAMCAHYVDFLKLLAKRSIACGNGGPSVLVDDSLEASSSSRSNECLRSGICSGVKQVRVRKQYAMDGHAHADSWEGCRHKCVAGSRGSLRTGGIFTWFCKHGVCYGFYVMPNAEGQVLQGCS